MPTITNVPGVHIIGGIEQQALNQANIITRSTCTPPWRIHQTATKQPPVFLFLRSSVWLALARWIEL